MTDMPDVIWAWQYGDDNDGVISGMWCDYYDPTGTQVKYTRAIPLTDERVKSAMNIIDRIKEITLRNISMKYGEGTPTTYIPEDIREHLETIRQALIEREALLEVARMVEQWGHGLRHETAHESKMVKAARALIAKCRSQL